MLRRAEQEDGLAYSPERKAAVLAKMLPPNNMPLGRLAKEEGISKGMYRGTVLRQRVALVMPPF